MMSSRHCAGTGCSIAVDDLSGVGRTPTGGLPNMRALRLALRPASRYAVELVSADGGTAASAAGAPSDGVASMGFSVDSGGSGGSGDGGGSGGSAGGGEEGDGGSAGGDGGGS